MIFRDLQCYYVQSSSKFLNPSKISIFSFNFRTFKYLGSTSTWGFEDLPLGGDMDYNDVVVRANLNRA
ncbi:MAG: DUF4114 domain-containing protein [Calothrix sp. FI2-JRJ7]|nr:DUF4114 domain-containing protein [Calothrix sp. FI2-JRJ7]